MRVGIVCYATVGGSGVVATELAHALAFRGHDVHLVSAELPFRWRWGTPGLAFERVDIPSYPLFREPQYLLALTSALVRVSRQHKLDVIHAHYAVPHATAAYLAHEILARDPGRPPVTVTTLHGTDITLVGSDPSYASVVGFSIEASHGVTAVSESLKRDTFAALEVRRDIQVIPNFLECSDYRRNADESMRYRLCPPGECDAIIAHVSNFRSVKRVELVVEIFRRIRTKVRARLVMVGDGPDRPAVERQVADAGLSHVVDFVGEQHDIVSWLSVADLFLLPSAQESFGLAALEAMSCEVPVVASRVGGIPEVISDGVTGFVRDPDDLDGMASCGIAVLVDKALGERIGRAAAAEVERRFCTSVIVPQYERYYDEVLSARGTMGDR
jgi:N-acetyl-alpha-D-glucosaminyl L-malate synthase BshA